MAGDLITCPSCQGWSPSETGWVCALCEGEGVIWNDEPDDDDEDMPSELQEEAELLENNLDS